MMPSHLAFAAATRLLAASVVVWLTAGCSLLGGGGGPKAEALPDLPRAAVVLGAGDARSFRGATFRILDIQGAGENKVITWSWERGKAGETLETRRDNFALVGNHLLSFQDPPRAAESPRPLILARLHYLPDLMRAPGSAPMGERLTLREKEVLFLKSGFVSLASVSENDYLLTDDDSARLFISTDGSLQTLEVEEFHVYNLGATTVRVLDVFPGEQQGEGIVQLVIVPTAEAWVRADRLDQVTIASGATEEIAGFAISSEPIESDDGQTRAYLRIRPPDSSQPVRGRVLSAGNAVRMGRLAVRFDEAAGEATRFTPFLFMGEEWAFPGRQPGVPVRRTTQQEETPSPAPEPTALTRTMNLGDNVDFWEARFELRRVFDNDRTSLADDEAEFAIFHSQGIELRTIREGTRETIHGTARWWVMDVQSVKAQDVRGGQAVVHFRTGTYLRGDEPPTPR